MIWTGMSRIMSSSFMTPAAPPPPEGWEDVRRLGRRGGGLGGDLLGHGGCPVVPADLAVVFGGGTCGVFHIVSHCCLPGAGSPCASAEMKRDLERVLSVYCP